MKEGLQQAYQSHSRKNRAIDSNYIGLDVRFTRADLGAGAYQSAWADALMESDTDTVMLEYEGDSILLAIEVLIPQRSRLSAENVAEAIRPATAAHGVKIVPETLRIYNDPDRPQTAEARVELQPSLTIAQLARAYLEVRDSLLVSEIASSPERLFSAILAGGPRVLVGMRESDVLEVKRAHYPKGVARKQLEFAADVASFANSTSGGIIVIGASTVGDELGRDIIVDAAGCSTDKGVVARYTDTINRLIYPAVGGVRMELDGSDSAATLSILVPAQRSTRQPFLVRGGITELGRVTSAAFQVPIRKGDANIPMHIEQVHSFLAGEAE
ncbi:MAG TPA: hypothetical protein VIW24_04550 [Aldersonia sp.]